jgi:flagellar assembly protein FliH
MAGIIKADTWEGAPTSVRSAVFNFEDMSTRAHEYLASVQQQAAEIIAAAQANAQSIELQAKQQGYEAALREAKESLGETLDQQLATLIPALQQAVEDIRRSKATWLRHWEQQTVELATAIAERVIRCEVRERPEITLGLIREALELAVGAGQITVQLCPADFEALSDRTESLASQLQSIAAAQVEPNPEVSPGGCRVVTEFGEIDQTFESQLARISEELM